MIHDAVRPLVSDRIIHDVVEALEKYEAVDTALPTIDTIIEVDEDHDFIKNIPNRQDSAVFVPLDADFRNRRRRK